MKIPSNKFEVKNLTLTGDPGLLNDLFKVPPQVAKMFHQWHLLSMTGSESAITELLGLVQKYPHVPQIKNFLSNAYANSNFPDRAFDVNQWIQSEHPDYLYGMLNEAVYWFLNKRPDRMLEVLGENLDLKELLPGRNLFHVSEYVAFEKVVVRYLLSVDNEKAAKSRIDILLKEFPDHPDVLFVKEYYENWLRKKEFELDRDYRRMNELIKVDLSPFWDDKVVEELLLKETEWLYKEGFTIAPDKIRKILEQPRDLLIHDLENMIREAVLNHDMFFENTINPVDEYIPSTDFIIHAFFFLAEIQSIESLPLMLETFKLDDSWREFWYDNKLFDVLWEPVYKLCTNQLDLLENFMRQPGISQYSTSTIADCVVQIACHDPQRRDEVIDWFRRLLEFYRDQAAGSGLVNHPLIGFMLCNLMDLSATELLPICRELFDQGKVDINICYSFDSLVHDMVEDPLHDPKRAILPLQDRYLILRKQYRSEEFVPLLKMPFVPKKAFIPSGSPNLVKVLPINSTKVPGRNEPCPCGSGKKYKKCCGNN
jgi:hypothetical protein